MTIKKLIGRLFFGVRIRQWMGYDQIVGNLGFIQTIFALFSKKIIKRSDQSAESFEMSLQRLGLTEQDLKHRMRISRQLIAFYICLAIVAFSYTIFIFHRGFWITGFMCSMLTLLFLGYTFREHFNYFQMKQRRLGCTFQEWLAWVGRGGKVK